MTEKPKPSDDKADADVEVVSPYEPEYDYRNISVQAKIDNLHINQSNLAALERLSERNPELAKRIVESGEVAAHIEYQRYKVGAIAAAVIAGGYYRMQRRCRGIRGLLGRHSVFCSLRRRIGGCQRDLHRYPSRTELDRRSFQVKEGRPNQGR